MVKVLAQRIAISMGARLQADRDRVEVFAYGLEIILGALVQLILIIWLSLIMNTFITTTLCLIAFASLRFFGGGAHASTYCGCSMVSVPLILALGKLATIDTSHALLMVFSTLTFLTGIFIIFRWAPAGTEKKQVKDEKTRQRQRKKAILILMLWFAATCLLVTQQFNTGALAVVLGTGGSLLLITPWGYRAIKALDNIQNMISRGWKSC